MEMYSWVSNEKKYLRAIDELKKLGKEINEENIKALYIKYGGLVIGVPDTQRGVKKGAIMPPVTGKPGKTEKDLE